MLTIGEVWESHRLRLQIEGLRGMSDEYIKRYYDSKNRSMIDVIDVNGGKRYLDERTGRVYSSWSESFDCLEGD